MITVPAEDLQPVDWSVVEGAVYDWITAELPEGTGFVWENQNAPQPPYPYVSALVSSIVPEGGRKERRTQYDATKPAGEELDLVTFGTFTFTLTLSAHVDADAGAYDPLCNAQAIATRLQWSLSKQSVCDTLSAANVAIVGELAQTDTSLVINEEWISRATLDVSLRGVAVVSESTTYIEQVSGQVDTTEPTRTFTYLIDSTP